MNGKTHRVGGLAVGSAASLALLASQDLGTALPLTVVVLTGSAFGSLIPDLDHKGAELSRNAKLASWVVRQFAEHRGLTHYGITALVFGFLMLGLNYIILNFASSEVLSVFVALIVQSAISLVFEFLPRRIKRKYGMIIRIAGLALSFVSVYASVKTTTSIVTFYSIGLSLGYASHLLLDSLTVSGIPLFGANRDNIRLANLRTGESETLVSGICYILTAIFVAIMLF